MIQPIEATIEEAPLVKDTAYYAACSALAEVFERIRLHNAARSIETALILNRDLRDEWKDMMQRAIETRDIVMQARLGQMRNTMSELDRHVRNARRNEYEE